MGISWESNGNIMEISLKKHGKIMEYHWQIMGESWKIIGISWELNIMRKSWAIKPSTIFIYGNNS